MASAALSSSSPDACKLNSSSWPDSQKVSRDNAAATQEHSQTTDATACLQARVVGYVEQVDVHSAGLTVEESLRFSAALRLTSDVHSDTRAAYVLEVLMVTELLDIRGNLVGAPGGAGLSVEQRRRLSIGVELVSNPSVMVRTCICRSHLLSRGWVVQAAW